MRTSACGSFLLLSLSPLTAQSVGVSLEAIAPFTVSASDGGQPVSVTKPVGPLPAFGASAAILPIPGIGSAGGTWQSFAGGSTVGLVLTQTIHGAVGPNFVGHVGPQDFVATFSSAQPRDVMLELSRVIDLPPGTPWPSVSIDVGNDGAFEVNSLSPYQTTYLSASFGPQPLAVRIVVDAAMNGDGTLFQQVRMNVLPDNDLVVTRLVVGCGQLQPPPPPPFLSPSFDDRGLDLLLLNDAFAPGAIAFGFSAQPQYLGFANSLPCVLLPAPDIVLFPPGYLTHLPLPAGVRPVSFFVQGVNLIAGGLQTTDGFLVAAN